jgi:predicted HTH transcriptional regulator
MSMNLKELRQLISDGESSRMEFKRSTGQRSDAANSFCHRDYAAHGGAVSVAMYDGRLEIISPGKFHFGITPAKLSRQHESKPWNPIIANVFYRAVIIEKWGSGTLNILEWCKANTNPKPSWTDKAGSVVMRFLPNSAAALSEQQESQLESQQESQLESQQESQLGSQQESQLGSQLESLRGRVLALLASGPLSKSEIAARLGQLQASGQLHKIIRLLIKEKSVSYTIPNKPQSRLQKYALIVGDAGMDSEKAE